jgi:CHAD domain-containing protein
MKAAQVKGLKPSRPLRPNAAKIVAVRLGELRGFAGAALQPGATEAQHDMRIAAKRLRYTLELTESCFEPAGKPVRQLARELQGVLGDLRDAEAMLASATGIASLESLLHTRRELLFARFQEFWAEDATAAALAALEDALA